MTIVTRTFSPRRAVEAQLVAGERGDGPDAARPAGSRDRLHVPIAGQLEVALLERGRRRPQLHDLDSRARRTRRRRAATSSGSGDGPSTR